jgi:2-aminoadipate transaminase
LNYSFSNLTQGLTSSAVREILKLTQNGSVISFAGGLPAEELFPVDAIKQAFQKIFDRGNGALQYGLTEGFTPLREKIAAHLASKGIQTSIDEMLLTTGSQQAIDLLIRIYINPGDVILVENPTYLAALQVFKSYGAQVIAVDSDDDGMLLNDLEQKLRSYKPKLVYVTPTFSNPAGKVWSLERRQGLLTQCKAANTLILEDDPYGEINFTDEVYPSIFSLDTDITDGKTVVYTSTFSKTVAPAIRSGWVIGQKEVITQMTRAKQASDLHSSTLDQQALDQLLTDFDLNGHIQLIREHYGSRMQLMQSYIREYLPAGCHWVEPKGGMFLWLELPTSIRSDELLKAAVKEGVAFVPGSVFYTGEPNLNTLRMNFTHTDPERMKVGMERLALAFQGVPQA